LSVLEVEAGDTGDRRASTEADMRPRRRHLRHSRGRASELLASDPVLVAIEAAVVAHWDPVEPRAPLEFRYRVAARDVMRRPPCQPRAGTADSHGCSSSTAAPRPRWRYLRPSHMRPRQRREELFDVAPMEHVTRGRWIPGTSKSVTCSRGPRPWALRTTARGDAAHHQRAKW
jgi:hypothetical protein